MNSLLLRAQRRGKYSITDIAEAASTDDTLAGNVAEPWAWTPKAPRAKTQ